jgi:hypothetical protein
LAFGWEQLKNSLSVIISLWLVITGAHAAGPLRSFAELRALPDEASLGGQNVRIEAVAPCGDCLTDDMIVHDGTSACCNFTDLRVPAPENDL